MQILPTVLEVHAELATPSPSMTVNPDSVTPGFFGFVAIAILAVVVVLLVIDMLRRIRRAGYRADINEQLDAEAEAEKQARDAVEASDVDDQDIDPGDADPRVDGPGR